VPDETRSSPPNGEETAGDRPPPEDAGPEAISPSAPPPPPGNRRNVLFLAIGIGGAGLAIVLAIVLILVLTRSGPTTTLTDADSPEEELTITAPAGLEANTGAFKVRLQWEPPEGGAPQDGYEITRDGEDLEVVDADTTTFVDEEAVPGQRYLYEVRSLDGDLVSTPAKVKVETEEAPPHTARLEGVFNVQATIVSESGYEESPDRTSIGWRFRPRCPQGPCPVQWFDIHFNSFKITLRLKGGAYSGSGSGQVNVHCGGADSISSVTLRLRPTKADEVGGEWRVTTLEGTFTHAEAAQLGCVSSRATVSVLGRLVD
jgi:hypothetical protein